MKAAIINQFGDPEVFEIVESNKPTIKSDQVLIKVKTSSINPIDWKQRKGNHKLILGSPFPITLGYDVCGEVVEIGSEIRNIKIGNEVFGVLDNKYGGALAEFAIGHENCFEIKPENISNEEAAAFPMVSLTALQALRDHTKIKPDQTILINGASGGVGHIAIQIAKLLGAEVIAVASAESKMFVDQFGPDEFIDYKEYDILKLKQKVNLFFDVADKYTFAKTRHLLTNNGMYLNLSYINSMLKLPVNKFYQLFSKNKKAKSFLMKHNPSDLKLIANWINQNKLKIKIDKTFMLNEISEAHKYAQEGHNKGKNIVVISN